MNRTLIVAMVLLALIALARIAATFIEILVLPNRIVVVAVSAVLLLGLVGAAWAVVRARRRRDPAAGHGGAGPTP